MIPHVIAVGVALATPTTQIGVASWYGKENRTSCTGKRLYHSKLEAAHKSIPLGTKVRVTSLSTKKSVVVTIVDRGPYTKKRILDLNVKAANAIGIRKKGVDKVRLDWKS